MHDLHQRQVRSLSPCYELDTYITSQCFLGHTQDVIFYGMAEWLIVYCHRETHSTDEAEKQASCVTRVGPHGYCSQFSTHCSPLFSDSGRQKRSRQLYYALFSIVQSTRSTRRRHAFAASLSSQLFSLRVTMAG